MNLPAHTLKSYDERLEHLSKLIVAMGELVHELVVLAKKSLKAGDEQHVQQAKAIDKKINELDHQLEEAATVVLALQNPMAVDLRFVTSALKIAGILERAGDLAKNTVKRSTKLGAYATTNTFAELEKMADITVHMLDEAIDALKTRDENKALKVWKQDDEVDEMYHSLFGAMLTEMLGNKESIEACIHLMFVAKNLERVADYATNLAKSVYYIATGTHPDRSLLH